MSTNKTGIEGSAPLWIVDAFASSPFTGNPAAVCVPEQPVSSEWMQQVGAEMNLSETAFIRPIEANRFELRWFTPEAEVDLCGHATLAAAHIVWETERLSAEDEAIFETKSGVMKATRKDGQIHLDFPAEPVVPAVLPESLIEALGFIPRYTGRNRLDYLVEADSEETVRGLKPDFAIIRSLDARGVIVTSRSGTENGAEYDFVSRCFYPAIGVDEDPVTGSAHCALAPYWAKRLRKSELKAYQASRRGGHLTVRHEGERVMLLGRAVTVLSGKLTT